MKTRVIVAAIGLPLLLAIVLACPVWCTAIVTGTLSALAVYELLFTAGLFRHLRVIIYSMVAAVAVCFWSCFGCPHLWGLALVWLYFTALFIEMIAAKTKISLPRICAAAFSALFVPFCLSALVRILNMGYGRYYILVALILPFASDSAAYFVGRAFGRHKLSPTVSPNKTVEGLIGGVAGSVLLMLLYCLVLQLAFGFTTDYLAAAVYGVVGSLGGVVGDLTFSVVKRQTGIKDYGNLLPGHGGVLDRFDSMTVTAPLTELLLLMMPLIVKG